MNQEGMTDNRNTREAEGLRRKSEFIRQVGDFAMYMQKEYLDPSDNLSLLVCAADASIDGGGRCGSAAIMLGDRWVGLTALASMMRQKEFAEAFRKARVLSTEDGDDGGMGDAMRGVRRRLRVDYSIEAGVALWAALIATLAAFGLMDWFTMVSNLILMAWTAFIVGRDIMPLRRQIRRMEESMRKDRLSRATLRMAEAAGKMVARAHRDDDEEDD